MARGCGEDVLTEAEAEATKPPPKRQRTAAAEELLASAQRSRVSRGQREGTASVVRPPIDARVRVCWPDGVWYDGTVVEADVELGRRFETRYRFRVAYDDGTVTWHIEGEEPLQLLLR